MDGPGEHNRPLFNVSFESSHATKITLICLAGAVRRCPGSVLVADSRCFRPGQGSALGRADRRLAAGWRRGLAERRQRTRVSRYLHRGRNLFDPRRGAGARYRRASQLARCHLPVTRRFAGARRQHPVDPDADTRERRGRYRVRGPVSRGTGTFRRGACLPGGARLRQGHHYRP